MSSQAPPHRRRTRFLVAPLFAALVAACAAGTQGTTTPASDEPGSSGASGRATDRAGGTPEAMATLAPGTAAATTDDLLAVAESLMPPGGVERGRTTSDGSAAIRWLTPDGMDDVRAHYETLAGERGLMVLLDAEAGGVQSWVFGDIPGPPVNATIQVTPMPGEGHLVSVMVTPA